MVVEIVVGLQEPIIPFKEVNGRLGATAFLHSDAIGLNVGIIWAVILISRVIGTALSSLSGVKIAIIKPDLAVFIKVGFQVPRTPFVEVLGRIGAMLF